MCIFLSCFFLYLHTLTTEIYTLSLHDALPISRWRVSSRVFTLVLVDVDVRVGIRRDVHRGEHGLLGRARAGVALQRSEEHTSELQPPCNLVCRLLLEKKKKIRREKKKTSKRN